MKPGIYKNVSWAEYKAIPYPSPSMLKPGLRSMRRLKRHLDEGIQPSAKTVAVGNALHAIVAGEFYDRYQIMPDFHLDPENVTDKTKAKSTNPNTKWCKAKIAEWRENLGDKEEMTEVAFNTAQKAYRELKRCKPAWELIKASDHEVTVIGEIAGVLCKTRLDGLTINKTIWDIKTTGDIEGRAFYRVFKRMNYWFQFAFHYLLVKSAGEDGFEPQDNYKCIAVETQGDYEVCVMDVPKNTLNDYEGIVRGLVENYRSSKQSGTWPGLYPSGQTNLYIPEYEMYEEAERVDWSGLETETEGSEVAF